MKLLKGLSSARGTKRALIASAACTLLCGLLLFSTSIAWFSATKESKVNELYSGNLDVELSYFRETDIQSNEMVNLNMANWGWKKVESSTDDIFEVNGEKMFWEPGAVNVVYFKIENKGNLAAKYDFTVEIDGEVGGTNFKNEPFKLSNYIYGGVVKDISNAYAANDGGRAQAIAHLEGTPATLSAISGTTLVEGNMSGANDGATETKTFALVLYMPEDAGDVTNYRTPGEGEQRPGVKLKVKLVATQDVGESDSFGDKYDEKAEVIMVLAGGTPADTQNNVKNAIDGAKSGAIVLLPATDDAITLPNVSQNITIKGAGQDKTEIANNTAQGISGNLSIQDVTFVGAPKGATYIGFQHTTTETYENCKFTGIRFFYGNTVVCKNCVFEQADYEYCFWTYGANDITFENCTFITKGKAAKVYHDNCAECTHNVTFKGCTFKIADGNAADGANKPAIAVDARGSTFNIIINNCTVTGYQFSDGEMTAWYNTYMNGATATQKMFIGCEGTGIGKVHVTIDGTKFN